MNRNTSLVDDLLHCDNYEHDSIFLRLGSLQPPTLLTGRVADHCIRKCHRLAESMPSKAGVMQLWQYAIQSMRRNREVPHRRDLPIRKDELQHALEAVNKYVIETGLQPHHIKSNINPFPIWGGFNADEERIYLKNYDLEVVQSSGIPEAIVNQLAEYIKVAMHSATEDELTDPSFLVAALSQWKMVAQNSINNDNALGTMSKELWHLAWSNENFRNLSLQQGIIPPPLLFDGIRSQYEDDILEPGFEVNQEEESIRFEYEQPSKQLEVSNSHPAVVANVHVIDENPNWHKDAMAGLFKQFGNKQKATNKPTKPHTFGEDPCIVCGRFHDTTQGCFFRSEREPTFFYKPKLAKIKYQHPQWYEEVIAKAREAGCLKHKSDAHVKRLDKELDVIYQKMVHSGNDTPVSTKYMPKKFEKYLNQGNIEG